MEILTAFWGFDPQDDRIARNLIIHYTEMILMKLHSYVVDNLMLFQLDQIKLITEFGKQ